MPGHWRLTRPHHALLLVAEADAEKRARGCAWFEVQILERLPGVIPDPAEAFRPEDFTAERLALWLELCEYERRHHPVLAMRQVYDRCAVPLEHELAVHRRAGVIQ